MSEINKSEPTGLPNSQVPDTGVHQEEHTPAGIAFQGNKTDLRYDPVASVNRAYVNQMIRTKIDGHEIAFGAKEINQVKKDLEHLNAHPAAVQKAVALFPAFQGYAKNDKLALALQDYAATSEFIKNSLNN